MPQMDESRQPTRTRGAWHAALLMTTFLLLFISGCAAPATATIPTTPPATATPSPVRSPTATPLPAVKLTSPVLGGSGHAFYTLYGQNNCCYKSGWNYQGSYGATWTGIWGADGFTTSPFADDNTRVTGIQTLPNGDPWTVTQALAMAKSFMPPDAKLLRSKSVTFLGTNDVQGVERVYSSTLLKDTLPAADFKDANGNPAQPGVFYVFLNYTYNGSPTPLVQWCTLDTDESEAQSV